MVQVLPGAGCHAHTRRPQFRFSVRSHRRGWACLSCARTTRMPTPPDDARPQFESTDRRCEHSTQRTWVFRPTQFSTNRRTDAFFPFTVLLAIALTTRSISSSGSSTTEYLSWISIAPPPARSPSPPRRSSGRSLPSGRWKRLVELMNPHPSQLGSPPATPRCDTFPLQARFARKGEGSCRC